MEKELKLSAPRTSEDSKKNEKETVEKVTKIAIDTYKEALKELEKY